MHLGKSKAAYKYFSFYRIVYREILTQVEWKITIVVIVGSSDIAADVDIRCVVSFHALLCIAPL